MKRTEKEILYGEVYREDKIPKPIICGYPPKPRMNRNLKATLITAGVLAIAAGIPLGVLWFPQAFPIAIAAVALSIFWLVVRECL